MQQTHNPVKITTPSQNPYFLIAPPAMHEASFQSAVILLTADSKEGAMGFNIARQTSLRFYEMLETLKIKPTVPDRSVLVGGPVSKNSGFVLYEHKTNKQLAPGIPINPNLSISPAKEILEAAALGKLPGRFELIIGYAGWGPGRLEAEFKKGIWMPTDFLPELMFDVPFAERWRRVYDNIGVSPLGFINVYGGAQA